MISARQARFAHRHNRDGTHDSICTSCMRTVALVKDETKLEGTECVHLWNPALTSSPPPASTWPTFSTATTFCDQRRG